VATEQNARLACAGESHRGRSRVTNEDQYYYDAERGILIVVDGVGGKAAGEKAAAIALQALRARLERKTGGIEGRIREAITLANNQVYEHAQAHPEWHGMACVLTVAVIDDGHFTVGHVGDTRLYQVRAGRIVKVTHDHSPVGEWEDAGMLTEIEAMRHQRRNEVYREVGSAVRAPEEEEFIELIRRPFDPHSGLILCTDGLSDMLTAAQVLSIVQQWAGDPANLVRRLIEAANEAGGRDNITVVYATGADGVTPEARRALKPNSLWPAADKDAEVTRPLPPTRFSPAPETGWRSRLRRWARALRRG